MSAPDQGDRWPSEQTGVMDLALMQSVFLPCGGNRTGAGAAVLFNLRATVRTQLFNPLHVRQRPFMNKQMSARCILLVATLLAIPMAQSAVMSKADYSNGKTRISAEYKTDMTACDSLAGNGKDVCVQEAKAKSKVARAELEYGYSGKSGDHNKVLVTKAESAYAVAKEKCDDKAGNSKDVCVKEAKAVEVKALSDAKSGKEIGEVKKDAAADRANADYNVAAEKCGALAGDAKDNCITAAKAKYAKD